MLTLVACSPRGNPNLHPDKLTGDFCDRLIAAIIYGTSYFEKIRGSRIERKKFRSTLTLSTASFCYIDQSLSKYDSRLVCKFFDAPRSQINIARSQFLKLENQVRACIIAEDRFGYGRDGYGTKYNRFWESEPTEERITFYDYWREQHVRIKLECQDKGCSLYLEINSM